MLTDDPTVSAKSTLRRSMRRARQALSAEQRREQAQMAAARVAPLLRRRRTQTIGAYAAIGSECDPFALQQLLRPSCDWFLPRLQGQLLRFGAADQPLQTAALGIPQPPPRGLRPAWSLQVLILPLLACDRRGMRLGQGGGWYDRTLAACRFRMPLRIGLGFAVQICDQVPTQAHDQPLDLFVSAQHLCAFTVRGQRWLTGC